MTYAKEAPRGRLLASRRRGRAPIVSTNNGKTDMAKPLIQRALDIDLGSAEFHVETIPPEAEILGPVDFGWQRYKADPEVMTFGEGLLASSTVAGTRRLVFCGYSPQWESFYISSMGGAAYTFQHVGVNYVCLRGRCEQPSVLLLHHDGKALRVDIEPLPDYEAIWAEYEGPDGEPLIGIYALQQAIFDRWGERYDPRRRRAFAVGPAALKTQEGTIGSNTVDRKGRMEAVVDWCGRGGMGSRLLQHHNLVGCLFGGDWQDPDKPKPAETNAYFIEHFGDKASKVDMAATVKYRYDPRIKTGGTFGSNFNNLRDKVMTFNYRSTFAPRDERLEHHRVFIRDHYLRQFNEETIEPEQFEHCGEPCPVACKKMNGKYKKDYEPYQALGPQMGVFDQRAAELLNDHADAMGMDAIQVGGMLAWIMECVADGLFPPEEFGFPPASEMAFKGFMADASEFDLVEDSMKNARYGIALIDAILFDERAALFRKGIRLAAYELNERYPDTLPMERAVFLSNGEAGHMVPNQYWVPGMGSPMPIMGKYYVYYGGGYITPEELGRKNVERMVYELINDNTGVCRFHRKWSEPLMPVIINGRYDVNVNFRDHHFRLAAEIHARERHKAVPWETERMGELFFNYLEACEEDGTEEPSLFRWHHHSDKLLTAQAFWQAIKDAQDRIFTGPPDAIPEPRTPRMQAPQP